MFRIRTGVAAALAVVAVPTAAVATQVLVDHGHGPTVTHDSAYSAITTQVHAWTRGESTRVRLMVEGLPPGRTFGAHVHTGRCSSDPMASGGHYQHSTDATVPLAQREVWLDVTSDAQGRGVSTTTVPWSFEHGTAGSVVIHAQPTNPATGAAGPRLACTTVDFGGHPGYSGD
jgi:Cu-Zn family superoxide dismutase